MTVSTTTFFVTALGNGATTVFNYDFIADNDDTMEVIYIDADDVETTLDPSQYTLVINSPAVGELWGVGGTVTYPLTGPAISTGTSLRIQRIVPYTQTVSINNQGAFYPTAVEQALDLLELQIQQLTGNVSGGTGGTSRDKEISFEWLGDAVPTSDQVIGLTSFPVEVTFLDGFAGATGKCLVNPTSTFVAGIANNVTHVGNMTIATDGTFTFDDCNCGNMTYSVGDYMTITAPTAVDATISNFSWTFKGYMN